MMRQYELVERVQQYNPDADEALLNKAYVYAMRAHGHQRRKSGAPYFTHPIEVAAILTDLHLDDATIAAALLHDTVEDTDTTVEELETLFGPDIAQLVDGLTKIGQLDLVSKKAEQAENLRKLLLAIATDVRVLLIKLADRLHNMRTLGAMPAYKRERIAQETIDIYAPLAGRMGMQSARDELEELSFRVLQPEAHARIVDRLARQHIRNAQVIAEIRQDLADRLAERGIDATVIGREKKPYSIWRKMQRKSIGFEQLSDIVGFRVIVPDVASCYLVLGMAHTTWRVVPGRFKDYISTPKQNDYRSIHTTVVDSHRQRVELQIRTREMDEVAEYGIAAHALYKERAKDDDAIAETPCANTLHGGVTREGGAQGDAYAYANLRRTIDLLAEGASAEEFLEHAKLELFQDQVFCFTPKGKVISLPRGATPIDFAYAVHTGIGNAYVGAKVNGRLSTINAILTNGDEVEVLTSESQQPLPAWEAIAVTGKAKSAIRRATRASARAQFSEIGRGILERRFANAGKTYSDSDVEAVLRRLARSSVEDVLIAIGRAEMRPADVLKAVHPDHAAQKPLKGTDDEGWSTLDKRSGIEFRFAENDETLPLRGLKRDAEVRFAPGGAVPGDRIVGIVEDDAIVVHPIHSPELALYYDMPDRWLDLRWDTDASTPIRFPATIIVTTANRPGALAEIARIIAEGDANIDNMSMTNRMTGCHEMRLDLEVWNLRHLNMILSRLRTQDAVSEAQRLENGADDLLAAKGAA
ncbi:MAG: bifunctional (p)ppGpp synthetase/guanosine-3',5'-bis(diphosphate) 3'-pyrophosphohydrolase [Pseudomonadota bacterium]